MDRDDDISAALPRPPFPAPARREAAIESALGRFDGAAEPLPDRARRAEAERPAPWWSGRGRPYAGALAAAFIVALVALPVAWTSLDERKGESGPGPTVTAASDAAADTEIAAADAVEPEGASN